MSIQKILLVDDSKTELHYMSDLLGKRGFAVRTAENGDEAMRRLNEDHVGFRAFGVSGLVLGTVAWAVNDSGVSIPALMLTVALPYTAYLVLGFDGPVGSDRRDDPLAADPAVAAADVVTGLVDGGAPG